MDRLETRLRSRSLHLTMNHFSKHWGQLWRVTPRWFYILATIAIAPLVPRFFACLPFHTKKAHFLEMVGLHPFRFLVSILAIWIDALVHSPLTGGPLFSINVS
jgi:hypothetical protein